MRIIAVFLVSVVLGSAEAWIAAVHPSQIAMATTSTSHQKTGSRSRLLSTEGDNYDGDNADQRKNGVRRIGGRTKRGVAARESVGKQGFPWWGVPTTILSLLFLKGVLDFGNDSSFAYYESTVYESRVYNSDGRMETSRKESFRSNIPSLAERLASPEDDVLQEMEELMKRQEAILDRLF